jgi:predicted nucleic acid-binding Zn ribbon protein
MDPKSRAKSFRQEILSEWRGGVEIPDTQSGIRKAGSLVDAILKSIGAADGIDEERVRGAWSELAGPVIAQHTSPVSLRKGELVLRVSQPAMRFHLEQMKPMLLERLRMQLGKDRLKAIRFTLG